MPRKKARRKPVVQNPPETPQVTKADLGEKLVGYSATAGAALVVMGANLALTTTASADPITYFAGVTLDFPSDNESSLNLDLNLDGLDDLAIGGEAWSETESESNGVDIEGHGVAWVEAESNATIATGPILEQTFNRWESANGAVDSESNTGSESGVAALVLSETNYVTSNMFHQSNRGNGLLLGAAHWNVHLYPDGAVHTESFFLGAPNLNPFSVGSVARGFLPVRFEDQGGDQHLAYLDFNIDYGEQELVLNGWAYESDPDTRIHTEPIEPIPEPSTLATLALGAAGLFAWRRHRGKQAEKAKAAEDITLEESV